MKTSFALDGHVDLMLTLGPLRRGPYDPTIKVGSTVAVRAFHTDEGPAAARYRIEDGRASVEAWGPGAAVALSRAPDLLGQSDDHRAFQALHPPVHRSHRSRPGLRMCKTNSVMEALIPTVIEQKVTSEEAHRSWARLVRAFGEPAPGISGLMLPPHPSVLASLPYHRFHPLGIERRRAEVIRSVARRADGLERCLEGGSDRLVRALHSFAGIGPWTSSIVAQVALGDPDAVIVGDYHLPNTVAWILAGEARADDLRMLELLEPYAGQRARAVRFISMCGHAPKFGPRVRLRNIAQL